MFYLLKKKTNILLMFQNITQTVKNKLFFSWFQTEKYANGWAPSLCELSLTVALFWSKKKLSELLREIRSRNNGDFYSLNCFHSFRTKNKYRSHKRAYENKDFCYVDMPSDGTKILEFNQCQKSDKAPFTIYAEFECIT